MSTITNAVTLSPTRERRSLATTTFMACSWEGHCLGDVCATNDDCDNDWICVNKVCSPCCNTSLAFTPPISTRSTPSIRTRSATSLAPSRATESPQHSSGTTALGLGASVTATTTAAAAASKSQGRLKPGYAVAIGVAIVVLVALMVGLALWVWYMKRRKRASIRKTPPIGKPRLNMSSTFAEDRSQLFSNVPRGELSNYTKPTELPSAELVELEGYVQRDKEMEKNDKALPSPPPPLPSIPPHTVPPHPRYRFEQYEVSPDTAGPAHTPFSPVSEFSPPPRYVERNTSQPYPRRDAVEDGDDTMFVARDGRESTYTLFRWPESGERSSRSPIPQK
ncbi:hypothetical protein P154DRAFT_577774 [Amniculicola lignicola CBS 123094]|uniref:Uncharacterized protein n=1 Tax=Amniculicola lignicola CBS 123094 TaxID=1392246 RepID=A0A6A5WLZ9_9PLEO|nr:hypothetical protein P154DRAFT_577774 [Amniculicola lignicola CBS 123094]